MSPQVPPPRLSGGSHPPGSRVRPEDRALEAAIRELLAGRARTATIRPSEAARRVVGEVELPQRGRVVDPSRFRGPVRIRRAAGR